MSSNVKDYRSFFIVFFFFNDTATTEIYTLSLHDALPISAELSGMSCTPSRQADHQSTTVQQYGKSKFYVRRLQLDTGSYTDSEEEEGDDEGSSTDEFNTAEFGK